MRWFRVYDDIIDDPKILRLPIGSRWFYICLMCVSSKQNVRGTLPDLEEIAIHLRARRAKVKEIIDELIAAGLIDEDPDTKGLAIHGWHKRQFKSDDVSARVETFRGGYMKRPGNVPRVRATESESDTESETEKRPPLIPPRCGGVAKAKKSPFVLPEWVPPEEWSAFVEMRGRIKAPLTDRAKEMAVKELDGLRAAGNDPARVLSQSVVRSWRGLFPAKPGEEPIKYHVAPPDSPYREIERRRLARLKDLFGDDGSAPAEQPGSGAERPGLLPAEQ